MTTSSHVSPPSTPRVHSADITVFPKSGPFLKEKRRREKKNRSTCSQCKPFSTRAWNPSDPTKSIPNTPVRERNPSSAPATSSTKASSASVRAPRAWNSSRIVIAGRGRLVNAPFARRRIRERKCATCRGRRLRRRRRGGSGERCEYSPPLLFLD